MANVGTASLNFGAAPGTNSASVAVTGQTGILNGTSVADAWVMYDSTADHNAEEHLLVPFQLRCGSVVSGTGFTVYAETELRLTGTFTVRWCWV